MSVRSLYVTLVVVLAAININCDLCSDKKSRKLRDFDGSRRNLISTTSTSCAINYFDEESVNRLTLNIARNAKSLRLLNLSSNRISTIPSDTFNQFSNLENLKLGDNFLMETYSHYFNGLKQLSVLDLSSNLIHKIEENSFLHLESLLMLNLADNCIINLAINLPIVALHSLNLSHNLIESFPNIKSIGALNSLDLSRNTNSVLNFNIDTKFSQIEKEKIAKSATRIVQSIKSLNIADNEISNLTQLQSFINLDELNLAGNPIGSTANVFPRFMDLEKLNLSGTNLTSLGLLMENYFKQIRTLSIGHNPMEANFESLQRFSQLQHLHLTESSCHEFDSFSEIRKNFPHLTHVVILYAQPNCKCSEKNKKLFSLYHIKFSTNWHHVCSRGQSIRDGRHNGVICFFVIIVFQALAKFN